jgi:outer membrane protein assembly factor BamE (lipoprotein component of BamABCDE complex)
VKVLFLTFLLVAGCAHVEPKPAEKPLGPGEILSAQAAQDVLSVGSSTKADVRAALGQAVVVDFASGYEVWVYRERAPEKPVEPPAPRAELVLLFAPSGILSKTRVR